MGSKNIKKNKKSVSDSIDALQKNGNYFYDSKLSIFRKIWLFLDLLIFSVIFITLSFVFSWVLDKYTVRDLDRNQSDGIIMLEITAQLLMIIIILYVIIIVIGRYIPSIYPNPPREHIAFKSYVLTVLIIFGVFAGEYKFEDKIRHIFNKSKDEEVEALEKLLTCPVVATCF
jgi:uncharacterized BrkB/YihY/UPF0761 family membrane protein